MYFSKYVSHAHKSLNALCRDAFRLSLTSPLIELCYKPFVSYPISIVRIIVNVFSIISDPQSPWLALDETKSL